MSLPKNLYTLWIYGTECFDRKQTLDIVQALPLPERFSTIVDRHEPLVKSGEITPRAIRNPSKEKLEEFFADDDEFNAVINAYLDYGYKEATRGHMTVMLTPHLMIRRDIEHPWDTPLEKKLWETGRQNWHHVAAIYDMRNESGRLDSRFSGYTRMLFEKIIAPGQEDKFIIGFEDTKGTASLYTKAEYLGKLKEMG